MGGKATRVAKHDSISFSISVQVPLERSGIHSVANDRNLQLGKFFFEKSGHKSRRGDHRLRAKKNFLRDIQPMAYECRRELGTHPAAGRSTFRARAQISEARLQKNLWANEPK